MENTLFEKYGGVNTVSALVDIFYGYILSDERVKNLFQQTNMERQKKHMTAFLSQALGGPNSYEGLDMRKAHAKLNLTEDHFNAVGEILVKTLKQGGVSEEDISAIMSVVVSLKDDVLNK